MKKLGGNGARAALAVGFLAVGLLLEHVAHTLPAVSNTGVMVFPYWWVGGDSLRPDLPP